MLGDECRFAVGVCRAIVRIGRGKAHLEGLVLASRRGIADEIVSQQRSVPMLEMAFDHVDVVRARAGHVSPDDPGVPRRDVVAPGRAPEVVVALGFQNGNDAMRPFAGGRPQRPAGSSVARTTG